MNLSAADLEQLETLGISQAELDRQLQNFQTGFPYTRLVRPATLGDGIRQLSESEIDALIAAYPTAAANHRLLKFVPASGAASRMFKALFAFAASPKASDPVAEQMREIDRFACWPKLKRVLEHHGHDPSDLTLEGLQRRAHYLLDSEGLGYGELPKGLLEFHSYETDARTAFEEHLVEAAAYATDATGVARLHFTVSPEHQERFESLVAEVKVEYETRLGVRFEIGFSTQSFSTDTVAVTTDLEPFRMDGALFFRPAGHGALLQNLQALEADLVFVKNIDNVVPDKKRGDTIRYKKALGALLLDLQARLHELLKAGDKAALQAFAKAEFGLDLPESAVLDRLNRPIRICGMVRNEGEPGGGPFWAESLGATSLQIVESAQIDPDDKAQQDLVAKATHFNPVDLVCGLRDYKGEAFDLSELVDPSTGLISEKSAQGQTLLAQERPGLWNGSMAGWLTLFVEVPISTFNPVKTFGDLLRPAHQND